MQQNSTKKWEKLNQFLVHCSRSKSILHRLGIDRLLNQNQIGQLEILISEQRRRSSPTVEKNKSVLNAKDRFGLQESQWRILPAEICGIPVVVYFSVRSNVLSWEIVISDVKGNDLYGEVPSSITKCSGLKYLDFSFHGLSGSTTVGIADLKRLLVIGLANNSIDGTIPSQFVSIE
ncbi:unnamed protein product [Fraxinus pennsylvanica]|uniref:Uncharacterized protein n=1 Tax=Fraxinus pennsylvanica TaxID=56036 RepID=A0AAD2DPN9_9LAMI|nr:unnamed protein product [Fraxinus pennsylvanica]